MYKIHNFLYSLLSLFIASIQCTFYVLERNLYEIDDIFLIIIIHEKLIYIMKIQAVIRANIMVDEAQKIR